MGLSRALQQSRGALSLDAGRFHGYAIHLPWILYNIDLIYLFYIAFFGQWSGNGPVSYYYPQMLQGAGISSNNTQLLLQGLQNVVQFSGAIFGALMTDRVGRRPQLLGSTIIMVFLFAIITGLNATNVTDGPDGSVVAKSGMTARAQIAMIFIFGFVYSAGWTPNQAMYPVECLRYESRAKGMGMSNVCPSIPIQEDYLEYGMLTDDSSL